jgi:tripartite-type tricarboxylate transporter receptor subunit TctC
MPVIVKVAPMVAIIRAAQAWLWLCLLIVLGVVPGHAQSAEEFYRGKTVSVVVGFPPGGTYDRYARLVAQHLPRHVPGQPTVIVQNMPGAGTMTAVHHLSLNAPKDGTTIVAFASQLATQAILEPGNVKFDRSKIALLGSISRDVSTCFTWHTVGPKSWSDLVKHPDGLFFGGPAKSTTAYQAAAVLKGVFGIKVKFIMGYPGSGDRRLAIEKGELNADCGSWLSTPGDWIRDKKIDVFARLSEMATPDMPAGVPYIRDLAKTEDDRKIIDFVFSIGEISKPYAVSAEVPQDRIETLRKAFNAMSKDPEFIARAEKEKLPLSFVAADKAQAIIENIYTTPPELVAKAKAILE